MTTELNGRHRRALPDALLALQQQRFRQILWLLMAAFGAVMLANASLGRWTSTSIELAMLGPMLLAYWWNRRGHLVRAAWFLIVTLMLGLTVLMVIGQGLFDEAGMAYPALLVFAGLFGNRRLLLWFTSMMVLSFISVYLLDVSGLMPHSPLPVGPLRAFNVCLIVTLSGFFVWLIVSDLRRVLTRLESEKLALQASHAQIEYLALRDSLTGLPNRVSAKEQLKRLLMDSADSPQMVAVLLLDLDNFKTINDSLGHAAGDVLLCQVADALGMCVGNSGMVARASGDEFFILLGGVQTQDSVDDMVGRIFDTLEQAFPLDGLDVPVTASVGIAMAPGDGNDASTLLEHADMAMYRAKESGRNTFLHFAPDMAGGAVEDLKIASRLRLAIAQNELQLHFQPQIGLRSGRITGAEALLRWQHPEWGLVAPARFIPIAERSGLIAVIGDLVMQQACQAARAWRAQGLGELVVAVNVSPLQFQRGNLEAVVSAALNSAGLPTSALELELTESSLLADAQHLSAALQRLSSTGVHITIDDFGTGYSNLGYLRRFAVDRLKIDQSFVRRMCTNPHDEGLVRAIIEMAHCLDLQVVAEGVEDAATRARLAEFGCEFGQGFHWSPALPMDAFVAFVRAHPAQGLQTH